MRRLRVISKLPACAQEIPCDYIQDDLQRKMCYFVRIMTTVVLPLQEMKEPDNGDAEEDSR